MPRKHRNGHQQERYKNERANKKARLNSAKFTSNYPLHSVCFSATNTEHKQRRWSAMTLWAFSPFKTLLQNRLHTAAQMSLRISLQCILLRNYELVKECLEQARAQRLIGTVLEMPLQLEPRAFEKEIAAGVMKDDRKAPPSCQIHSTLKPEPSWTERWLSGEDLACQAHLIGWHTTSSPYATVDQQWLSDVCFSRIYFQHGKDRADSAP